MNDEDRLVFLLGCTRREIENLSTPKWMPADTVWLLLNEVKRLRKEVEKYGTASIDGTDKGESKGE